RCGVDRRSPKVPVEARPDEDAILTVAEHRECGRGSFSFPPRVGCLAASRMKHRLEASPLAVVRNGETVSAPTHPGESLLESVVEVAVPNCRPEVTRHRRAEQMLDSRALPTHKRDGNH